MKGATQSNLIITPHNESVIQVDNLEVAQFIYLLLNNEKVRTVIDTITSKVVLKFWVVSARTENEFSTRSETSSESAIIYRFYLILIQLQTKRLLRQFRL